MVTHVDKGATIHLVVRYSDRFLGGVDTIARHREVLREHGCVWVGKIGRGLTISDFRAQLEAGVPTYLYLAKQGRSGLMFTRGRLLRIQRDMPTERTEAIPPYYYDHELPKTIQMWMLVGDLHRIRSAERGKLITRSSRRPVTETLATSSAGAFVIVSGEPGQSQPPRQRKSVSPRDFASWDEDDEFEPRSTYDDV